MGKFTQEALIPRVPLLVAFIVNGERIYPSRTKIVLAIPRSFSKPWSNPLGTDETPYKATHTIFVREGAETACDEVDEIPAVMRIRLLSLRVFDTPGMMVDATQAVSTEFEASVLWRGQASGGVYRLPPTRARIACSHR